MRKVITQEEIDVNRAGIRRQLERFIDFSDGKALLLDNGDWLKGLEYITFLRDIGRHFSVNRMIKAESYKMRIDSEEGLSFIEFNYMLLQAYDFMELSRRHDCLLQMGGSDQWGNIVAGIDLVRRTQQKKAFGITFPLITTSSGIKMGKTHKGAVWLDPERTSPYEYYQFWINCDDADVARFMALFTFLPMAEIDSLKALEGAMFNKAKAVLAWETTIIAHGKNEAIHAYLGSAAMFGAPEVPLNFLPSSSIPREALSKSKAQEMILSALKKEKNQGELKGQFPSMRVEMEGTVEAVPSTNYDKAIMDEGLPAVDIFCEVGLCKSKSEARRLLGQGGGYLNGERIATFDQVISTADMNGEEILLRAGKKKYHKIVVQ